MMMSNGIHNICQPPPKSHTLGWLDSFVVVSATFTFKNISVISWRLVLLVEETGVHGENHRPDADKLYHIMLYRVHLARNMI
jgi:hypothetical protein